jgi:peptidyl-prolyl cis-trans isomerase D
MITWLQTFFMKHNKWLFGGLLVVVIVTFVLTIGPQSFFDGGRGTQRRELNYFGYNLSSERDQRLLTYHAEISAMLHPDFGVRRDQLMDYAYLRAAALGIANQVGIPAPAPDALESYVRSLMIFQDRQTGVFSAETYNQIVAALSANAMFSAEALARVLREDWRIARVREALGGAVTELPFEIEQDYIAANTGHQVELAHYDYRSFRPELEPDLDTLRAYYEGDPARYETPERIHVTALHFRADSWLDAVPEPAVAELEAYFARNRGRYESGRERPPFMDPDDELPPVTFAEARERALADYRRDEARRIAEGKSEDFSMRLWERSIRRDSPAFSALVEEFRAATDKLAPYVRDQAPTIPNVPRALLNSMWIYPGGNRYFSDIGQNRDGAVLLVLDQLEPSRLPGLEEILDRVTADWREQQRRRLFADKGEELHLLLQDALHEGQPFAAAATELGMQVVQPEPFTGATVPEDIESSLVWRQCRYLPAGSLTRMILDSERGTFAYVVDRQVPEVDFAAPEFAAFKAARGSMFRDAAGWARLREITDSSLGRLLEQR